MRYLILLFIVATAVPAAIAQTIRLSEPVETDEASETFGETLGELSEVITLSAVLSTPDAYVDQEFALRVAVRKVCQKKGCFFIAQEGPATIRVAFKDYGFFVPTDIAGKTVTLVGTLKKRELSQKEAEHYSKDLGGDDSIRAGLTHEIVATAVRVPRG